MRGEVIKSTGKWYKVLLEDGQTIQASIKGKLRLEGLKTTNPIAAGDVVDIKAIDASGEMVYTIRGIEKRKNYLVRKSTNLASASAIAQAFPNPFPAPVTRAVLFFRSIFLNIKRIRFLYQHILIQ